MALFSKSLGLALSCLQSSFNPLSINLSCLFKMWQHGILKRVTFYPLGAPRGSFVSICVSVCEQPWLNRGSGSQHRQESSVQSWDPFSGTSTPTHILCQVTLYDEAIASGRDDPFCFFLHLWSCNVILSLFKKNIHSFNKEHKIKHNL